jgi:hypothetical protein
MKNLALIFALVTLFACKKEKNDPVPEEEQQTTAPPPDPIIV